MIAAVAVSAATRLPFTSCASTRTAAPIRTDTIGPREPGIPDLGLRIQQTFFSRQQGADAVHVDAAPFEDHGTCGLDARQPELLRDQIRDDEPDAARNRS